jgi:acetyl esterase/lipase
MGSELDPEVAQALAPIFEAMAGSPPLATGDVETRRVAVEGLISTFFSAMPAPDDVKVTEYEAASHDGFQVPLRLYTKDGAAPGPLVVYLHGGGMIMGSVELYDRLVRYLTSTSGVTMLAPDYRLAPEHPDPSPVEDCYAGLKWAAEHAAEHGIDPNRIGVAGDSAGGGLAAGVALLARDRGGPALARQILIYPMLDDRNTTPRADAPGVMLWSYDDNITGWDALLGAKRGGDDVSPYAAPARAESLAGLAPAYVMVGDLDIFRDEDIAYVARMTSSGVPVEFHLVPGAPHGFDFAAQDSEISKRAYADEIRAFRKL